MPRPYPRIPKPSADYVRGREDAFKASGDYADKLQAELDAARARAARLEADNRLLASKCEYLARQVRGDPG